MARHVLQALREYFHDGGGLKANVPTMYLPSIVRYEIEVYCVNLAAHRKSELRAGLIAAIESASDVVSFTVNEWQRVAMQADPGFADCDNRLVMFIEVERRARLEAIREIILQ